MDTLNSTLEVGRIQAAAVSGKYAGWDLEAVGGRLLSAGATFDEASAILEDVADARQLAALKPYVRMAYDLAAGTLGPKVNGRLERALDLAAGGAVQIIDDHMATVRSAKHNGDFYTVNGCCTCPDDRAPIVDGRKACKHQLAVWLVAKAHELMVWGE